MKVDLELPEGHVPNGYEVIAVRSPRKGDLVITDNGTVFTCEGTHGFCARLILRKTEPTYAEKQAKWVAENDIREGSVVKLTRGWESGEEGFSIPSGDLSRRVGAILVVKSVREDSIRAVDGYSIPYFALEVYKGEYRPFRNIFEYWPFRDKWASGLGKKLNAFPIGSIGFDGVEGMTWEEAFEAYRFIDLEDGEMVFSPFGVKV